MYFKLLSGAADAAAARKHSRISIFQRPATRKISAFVNRT
jgi:hypothetical protein